VKLKEQINELLQKIESLEGESVTDVVQSRLELKIKELESKLELEQTTRGRMETQV
jgi:myosin-18